MKVNTKIGMRGHIHIVVRGADGAIKDERRINNLAVTAGREWVAQKLSSAPPTDMSHMACGTNGTAPALTDTTLGAESARVTIASKVANAGINTYTATFPAGTGTGALQEIGIFNAAAAGTMLARATFAVINKGAADTMTVEWGIDFT